STFPSGVRGRLSSGRGVAITTSSWGAFPSLLAWNTAGPAATVVGDGVMAYSTSCTATSVARGVVTPGAADPPPLLSLLMATASATAATTRAIAAQITATTATAVALPRRSG